MNAITNNETFLHLNTSDGDCEAIARDSQKNTISTRFNIVMKVNYIHNTPSTCMVRTSYLIKLARDSLTKVV